MADEMSVYLSTQSFEVPLALQKNSFFVIINKKNIKKKKGGGELKGIPPYLV